MRLKAKKILAILLMLSIVLTALPAPVMAAPGGNNFEGGDGGSSGATYNEATGSADIVTGTASGGADKFASRNQWAITEKNGTFTRIINKHIKRYLSNILTLS
jgi:hypothetical protein